MSSCVPPSGPERLSAYTFSHPLGKGATARVWAAERNGRPVAVKVIGPCADAAELADQELLAQRLAHPHIARVLGGGAVDAYLNHPDHLVVASPGARFVVQELVSGKSLHLEVATWGSGARWRQARQVLLGVLYGLQHAHERGLIHRDIKPHNLFVPSRGSVVKILDWGLCWDLERGKDNPFRGRLTGTPNYMAPEQVEVRWEDYGPWSDLYAVGCLAWWLITGRTVWEERDQRQVLRNQARKPTPKMPSQPLHDSGAPDGAEEWCQHLLRKAPAERPQSAREAVAGLLDLGGER